jgi:hypothetical protein
MPFHPCPNHAHRYRVPRNMRALSCLVAILALTSCRVALAQDPELRTHGDPAARSAADTQLKRIYELASGPVQHVELITRDNPLRLRNAVGTEVTASIIDGSAARIVANVWTSKGKHSIEFYRFSDKLLMVYQTFTHFQESAPRDAWHNFMGLAAWESRIYFGARGQVTYAETRGHQAPPPQIAAKELQQQAQRLVNLLSDSPARWNRR